VQGAGCRVQGSGLRNVSDSVSHRKSFFGESESHVKSFGSLTGFFLLKERLMVELYNVPLSVYADLVK